MISAFSAEIPVSSFAATNTGFGAIYPICFIIFSSSNSSSRSVLLSTVMTGTPWIWSQRVSWDGREFLKDYLRLFAHIHDQEDKI